VKTKYKKVLLIKKNGKKYKIKIEIKMKAFYGNLNTFLL